MNKKGFRWKEDYMILSIIIIFSLLAFKVMVGFGITNEIEIKQNPIDAVKELQLDYNNCLDDKTYFKSACDVDYLLNLEKEKESYVIFKVVLFWILIIGIFIIAWLSFLIFEKSKKIKGREILWEDHKEKHYCRRRKK